jgi:homoaconitase/3-isopropylmalate dehydratase large subunit
MSPQIVVKPQIDLIELESQSRAIMATAPLGVRLTGRLKGRILAIDLTLVVTQLLRGIDLQGKYVEFFGPGIATLTAGERAAVTLVSLAIVEAVDEHFEFADTDILGLQAKVLKIS